MNTKPGFSILSRNENLKKASENKYDLLIIGGGITGAGIALDATLRGLKTILIEMQDFAAGTSSRSTKLVHGGLRYLEQMELGLVKEVGREREIVHTNAAHIVIPEKMILLIIEGGSLGKITTSVALTIYDYLAGVKKEEHRRMLSKEETLEKVPLIDENLLKGGALYYEYKTDDSRLTVEVLKKAHEKGALCLNYAKAENFIYNEKKQIIGIEVTDLIGSEKIKIYADTIVNATGPWVDQLRLSDNSLKGKRIHHTKGVHIVIDKNRFPLNHALYFDTGDNRMIFAIPRTDIVYVGTTDTDYKGNFENPEITQKDVQYLLNWVNRLMPSLKLEIPDVKSAWAGLRPLIHEDGKAPSELSRKDEIFLSETGLISIAGGKLTGYRVMAKKVLKIVTTRLKEKDGREFPKCQTRNMRLAGGEFPFYPETSKLIEYADKKFDEARQTGISSDKFKRLFYRYGMNIDSITEKAFDFFNINKNTDAAWLKAEIWYGIHFESVTSLSDFFIRRTGMYFFYVDEIVSVLEQASEVFKEFLNLEDNIIETQKKEIKEMIYKLSDYSVNR
jgi:glycerol-3-phosphate dehydrogenase